MSTITSVELDVSGALVLSIARALSADLFPGQLDSDQIDGPGWGIAVDGSAYYDPAGAPSAQRAVLGYDPENGRLVLSATSSAPTLEAPRLVAPLAVQIAEDPPGESRLVPLAPADVREDPPGESRLIALVPADVAQDAEGESRLIALPRAEHREDPPGESRLVALPAN